MSEEADTLRKGLAQRRERLSRLRLEMRAVEVAVEQARGALKAEEAKLAPLLQRAGTEEAGIAAVEAALAVLAERLPAEAPVDPAAPAVPPKAAQTVQTASAPARQPYALDILRDAEEVNMLALSERDRSRAERVRGILANSEAPMTQEEVIREMRSHEPSDQKALSAVRRGLAILVADSRVRLVSSTGTWELTPPEKASGNLGVKLSDYQGRTTSWPSGTEREPKPGARIVVEEGSYEGGKRR